MCLAEIYGCKIAVDSSFGPETNEACSLVAKGDKGLLIEEYIEAGKIFRCFSFEDKK